MAEKIIVKPDPDLIDLIPGYLRNRRTDVVELKKAFAAKDFPHIRSIGHSIKGSGAGYGFDGLTLLGAELETAARDNSEAAVLAKIAELENYLLNVEIAS
ncbi:MAG: Hpt domain-containing protein [Elusimicrobiaceae bacterium]|nr:Hpt domain-containing protein [Elusimicrobiaceae bacterium]